MSETDNPFDKDWTNPVDEIVDEHQERMDQLEFMAEEFERIQEATDADKVDFYPNDVSFQGDVIIVNYRWGEDDE